MAKDWSNRIVGFATLPASQFLANEDNWRIHPARQQDAMKNALNNIGWLDTVIVNKRTSPDWGRDWGVETLIDGHMRVTLAFRQGDETPVPVTYVDLTPEEEAYALATFDPLGQLAVTDNDKLLDLVTRMQEQDKAAVAALRGAGIDNRKQFSHISPDQTLPENAYNLDAVAGKAKPEKQASEQKYPLAIVLDRRNYERWLTVKAKSGARTDTDALSLLLDKVI